MPLFCCCHCFVVAVLLCCYCDAVVLFCCVVVTAVTTVTDKGIHIVMACFHNILYPQTKYSATEFYLTQIRELLLQLHTMHRLIPMV